MEQHDEAQQPAPDAGAFAAPPRRRRRRSPPAVRFLRRWWGMVLVAAASLLSAGVIEVMEVRPAPQVVQPRQTAGPRTQRVNEAIRRSRPSAVLSQALEGLHAGADDLHMERPPRRPADAIRTSILNEALPLPTPKRTAAEKALPELDALEPRPPLARHIEPVPEPGTFLMVAIGLAGLAHQRRRARRA